MSMRSDNRAHVSKAMLKLRLRLCAHASKCCPMSSSADERLGGWGIGTLGIEALLAYMFGIQHGAL